MDKPLITVENLHYTYQPDSEQPIVALRGVSLEVLPGEHLAIVGQNGSGKSTLAKCLNGLLRPSEGSVQVGEWSTSDQAYAFDIRAQVGIVLQTPDNQFVATTVEEEIAFGPENLGVPQPELSQRVEAALRETGLESLRQRNPRLLAAGQKARLAVASILAMQPACLILDESTALLDPLARREMLQLIQRLVQRGLAVVAITHFMDEAALADRVVVLHLGEIVRVGAPQDVLTQGKQLAIWGLEPTGASHIAEGLRQRGVDLPESILTTGVLASALLAWRDRQL